MCFVLEQKNTAFSENDAHVNGGLVVGPHESHCRTQTPSQDFNKPKNKVPSEFTQRLHADNVIIRRVRSAGWGRSLSEDMLTMFVQII